MEARNRRRLNWAILATLTLLGVSMGTILDFIISSGIPPYIAPRPDQLFIELVKSPSDWAKAALWTTCMSLVAAFVSAVLGITVGFLAALKRLWSVDRWAQLIWSIPLIAIATYLLIAVGYGWAYGLSLAVFLGVYPIEKHVFDYCSIRSEGMNSISASFSLSTWQEYRYLRLPGALRSLGTALSQSIPLCFIGETMGEYTSAQISPFSIGLGGLLRFAQNYSNYSRLWMAIILMMLLVFWSGEIARFTWAKWFPFNQEGDVLQ